MLLSGQPSGTVDAFLDRFAVLDQFNCHRGKLGTVVHLDHLGKITGQGEPVENVRDPTVVVGWPGKVFSKDGDGEWRREETSTNVVLNAVTHFDHGFVAVGDCGTILTRNAH